MKTVSFLLLGIVIVIARATTSSEQQLSAFITGSHHHRQNADLIDSTIYTDSDLHQLVLHNLGLPSNHNLTHSSKKIISKYGESTLVKKTTLNYLFLIDSNSGLTNKNFTAQDSTKHSNVKLDVCSQDNIDTCIVDLLYNRDNKKSVVQQFEKLHGVKASNSNYFYSSDAHTSSMLNELSLSLGYDANGNVEIVQNGLGKRIPLRKNLEKCVNEIVKDKFQIDLKSNVIMSATTENPILIDSNHSQLLKSFMEDICSVVSLSQLVRKDVNPTLLTFYISSMTKLESILDAKHKEAIHQIWSMTYTQFKANINKHFSDNEVSGQIAIMNNERTIEVKSHQKQKLNHSQPRRVLANSNPEEGPVKVTLYSRQQIIFRVFAVLFVIILALILVAMSSIEIQKDSLVYSKFLAGDQRK